MAKNIRLDKYLVHVGYGSRSIVQKLIKSKKVKVNGEIVVKPEKSIDPVSSEVYVGNEMMEYQEQYHFILNKPGGYITATEDTRDETVLDLLSEQDQNKDVFPVGRLDKDTEGLLVLTTDGQMAHKLLSPKKHVDKKYYAKVNGVMENKDIEIFAQGITLEEGTKYQPGKLEILSAGEVSEIYVTICEGKFHQVKKMVSHVGKEVIYLQRVQMGALKLPEDLELGEYRKLTPNELELLFEK